MAGKHVDSLRWKKWSCCHFTATTNYEGNILPKYIWYQMVLNFDFFMLQINKPSKLLYPQTAHWQDFQAAIEGMGREDFNVDFPSLLPGHPAFLYELNGLGGIVISFQTNKCSHRWLSWPVSSPCGLVQLSLTVWAAPWILPSASWMSQTWTR